MAGGFVFICGSLKAEKAKFLPENNENALTVARL